MKIFRYIKKGIDIAILNKKTIKEVTKDKNATKYAISFFVVGSLIALFFDIFKYKGDITTLIYSILVVDVFAMLIYFIGTHVLAKSFGSKEKFIGFFRSICLSLIISMLYPLILIPKVGILFEIILSIWFIFIIYFVTKETYKLSRGKTIGLLFSLLGILIIFLLFASIFGIALGVNFIR